MLANQLAGERRDGRSLECQGLQLVRGRFLLFFFTLPGCELGSLGALSPQLIPVTTLTIKINNWHLTHQHASEVTSQQELKNPWLILPLVLCSCSCGTSWSFFGAGSPPLKYNSVRETGPPRLAAPGLRPPHNPSTPSGSDSYPSSCPSEQLYLGCVFTQPPLREAPGGAVQMGTNPKHPLSRVPTVEPND